MDFIYSGATPPPATEPKIRRPLEIKQVGWWQLEQVPDAEWRYAGQGAAIRAVIIERTASGASECEPLGK